MRSLSTISLVLLTVVAAAPAQAQEVSYDLPTYTDSLRWNRAGTLFIAALVGDLVKSKEQGMSAAESGRASAKVFGPPNGWNRSDTPFVLFRGMYYNWMSHPDQTCELLEAGENLVRARCNRPYLGYFGTSGESYGVTVAQYEEMGLNFAATIADYHGMDWQQRVDGDDVMITIRKR